MSIKYEEKNEREEILNTLIKSYKLQEEKANILNSKEDQLKLELKGGLNQEKERGE